MNDGDRLIRSAKLAMKDCLAEYAKVYPDFCTSKNEQDILSLADANFRLCKQIMQF